MKNALLQPGAKGICLRLLACVLTFVLVSASVFCVFEMGFADENDVGIEDIQLVNADDPSESYGFWSSSDKVKTITINNKGGQVNLMCVAWWWPDGSNSSNPTGTTLVSSDENIVSVYGMTITAVHDGDAYLTLTVSENTVSGEPLTLVVPVHVTGQDAVYIESMNIYCEEAEEYQYDGTGYLTIETETLYEIYLHFYLIVTAINPSTGERIDYDTRNGQLAVQNPDLADPEWRLTDENLGVISDDGMFHPTEYGINSIWAGSYGGLDGTFVRTGEIRCNFPNPEQGDPEAHPQDGVTFNAWYENYSGENDSMPGDPNLVYSEYYDLNDLEHVSTFTETYTMVSGINATAVTAQGYGVDLEALLVEACGLDPDQGVGAIKTLRFYDHSGAYKEMSASWLFQTRYYYPNIDIGSTAGTGVRIVKPMLAFDSWWQRGNNINWDAEMTDSTRFRLLFGSTSATESVTSFSWKWVNRVDVVLYPQQVAPDSWKVTFDPTNGDEPFVEAVDIDGFATPPDSPTRDGYTFTGWFTEDGVQFDFSTPITGDITLYAGWVEGEPEPTPEPDNPDNPENPTPDNPQSQGSGSGGDGDDTNDGSDTDGSGSDSGSGNGMGSGGGTGTGNGTGDGSGTGEGTGSGDGSGFDGGQGGEGVNPNGGTGAIEGGSGDDTGFAYIGSREGAEGTDLGSFFSEGGSTGEDQTPAGGSSGLGSNEFAYDEQGSEQTAAGGDLGTEAIPTDDMSSGEWNMYQIMNPYNSNLGIEVEDNPMEPFVLPISSGALAVGGLESLFWFLMQRRRTDLFLMLSDNDSIDD